MKMGNKTRFGKHSEFCFEDFKFEMPTLYPCKYVKSQFNIWMKSQV